MLDKLVHPNLKRRSSLGNPTWASKRGVAKHIIKAIYSYVYFY
jgi:hypothetical protein